MKPRHDVRENRVHGSLLTPILFLGGERELALLTVLFSVGLVVLIQTVMSLVLGLVIWLVTLPLLRLMARKDHQFSQVYRRSLQYRRYYPPSVTPWQRSSGSRWQRRKKR